MERLYLISAPREDMMMFVYDELLNHTASSHIQYKTGMNDGTYGIYIKVGEHYEKYFLEACRVYGIKIRWKEAEAA